MLGMPYTEPCILVVIDAEWHRFESDISIKQHKFLNDLLNEQVRSVWHAFERFI